MKQEAQKMDVILWNDLWDRVVKSGGSFMIDRKFPLYEPKLNKTLHWHDYYEIEFVADGCGTHIVNNESYTLQRGSVYVMTPSDFHTILAEAGENLCMYTINFSENMLPEAYIQKINSYSGVMKLSFSEEEFQFIQSTLEHLLAEYTAKAPYAEGIIRAGLEHLFLLLLRKLDKPSAEASGERPANPSLQSAVAYLRRNFRKDVTLADIAREVHVTPNYLGALFHAETGLHFLEYLRGLRLQFAWNLLFHSDMNVNQIAAESGFHSVSYFIELFKRQYGATPRQLRLRHLQTVQK